MKIKRHGGTYEVNRVSREGHRTIATVCGRVARGGTRIAIYEEISDEVPGPVIYMSVGKIGPWSPVVSAKMVEMDPVKSTWADGLVCSIERCDGTLYVMGSDRRPFAVTVRMVDDKDRQSEEEQVPGTAIRSDGFRPTLF